MAAAAKRGIDMAQPPRDVANTVANSTQSNPSGDAVQSPTTMILNYLRTQGQQPSSGNIRAVLEALQSNPDLIPGLRSDVPGTDAAQRVAPPRSGSVTNKQAKAPTATQSPGPSSPMDRREPDTTQPPAASTTPPSVTPTGPATPTTAGGPSGMDALVTSILGAMPAIARMFQGNPNYSLSMPPPNVPSLAAPQAAIPGVPQLPPPQGALPAPAAPAQRDPLSIALDEAVRPQLGYTQQQQPPIRMPDQTSGPQINLPYQPQFTPDQSSIQPPQTDRMRRVRGTARAIRAP